MGPSFFWLFLFDDLSTETTTRLSSANGGLYNIFFLFQHRCISVFYNARSRQRRHVSLFFLCFRGYIALIPSFFCYCELRREASCLWRRPASLASNTEWQLKSQALSHKSRCLRRRHETHTTGLQAETRKEQREARLRPPFLFQI